MRCSPLAGERVRGLMDAYDRRKGDTKENKKRKKKAKRLSKVEIHRQTW